MTEQGVFSWQELLAPLMGKRPLVAGIVNVTPDSFSDGKGSVDTAERVAFALQLLDEGADLLDIGAESTRPGAREVPPEEEWARLESVLKNILSRRPDTVISIDTRHSTTAVRALQAGAKIINDVSGLAFDPAMAAVAAKYDAAVILGHTRGTPQEMTDRCSYTDVVREVISELKKTAEAAAAAGIRPEKLWFDPGIGFAKTAEQSWELLRHLDELAALGPLVIGHSRKSFLGYPAGADRDWANAAVIMYLRTQDVSVVRVHDIRSARIMFDTAEKLAVAEEAGGK